MSDRLRTSQVIVIGAGASGVLVAVQFQRTAPPGSRIVLVEAGARAARGLAYGTPYGAHLLNVPAGKMSAFADDPGHFLRWLKGRLPEVREETFVPRTLFGDYLGELLGEEQPGSTGLFHLTGTAVGLTRNADCWVVHLHDGRTLRSHNVVLALGNLPPADPLQLGLNSPLEYFRDPWAPGAALGLAREGDVLLIGSGLTMLDLALALRDEGHRGKLHAISRHGHLPHAHAAYSPWKLSPVPDQLATPRKAFRWLRNEMQSAGSNGSDWRAVIDALRPHTTKIWRQWSRAGQASFLAHARWLWEVHRHRMAPEVAQQIAELRSEGRLSVSAGVVLGLRSVSSGLEVRWRPARETEPRTLSVARVFNCTGPAGDYSKVELPLVVEMRRAGWLTPSPLGLGVETDEHGQLLGVDGRPIPGLWTLGPLCRAALWESTAIPEIRFQAQALARALARD